MQNNNEPRIIALTEGNDLVSLHPMQEFLMPYLDYFQIGYWVLFWSVLFYLLFKHLLTPLLKTVKTTSPKEKSK